MSRTASIKDVAARAGVSLATVSNVLNRPQLVSEDTLVKVRRAIEDLGYVRNESARQLRAGTSRAIAYVLLDASNPFFTDVALGAQESALDAGVLLQLCNSRSSREIEDATLDHLLEQRVRGVLVTPVDPANPKFAQLRERGVPVVFVDRVSDARGCSVAVDDVTGGRIAITHLIEAGHRKIAFVGGPMSLPQVRDRLSGAREAMAQAGRGEADLVVLETDGLNVSEGRNAGQRLAGLPRSRRPSAAFCANDLTALGLLQAMTRLGVAVPDQLAIVGYDDIEFAEAAAVPLTSVRQPRELLGRTATEMLLEEADAGAEHTHRQVEFQPELVVRASSASRPA